MPYIRATDRGEVRPLLGRNATGPGELNYQITKLLLHYQAKHGLSYQTINDIVGALECAKLELYRRVAVPYENSKMAENGDVYE